ncbi:hypothetical protein KCU67_g6540, partial [Aureobasidium melanogenum]
NCPLDVVDVIVILDKGGFGGMTVGCKYSEADYRVLPYDYDTFYGTLCLPGWSAAANIDSFCRGTSLAQICELTRTGLVIQYNQYTHVVTPEAGVQVTYDNAGVARQDTIVNTPKNTFWVFVPPIQPNDDLPISHLESQESIAEYMLRRSIEHNNISFRLDLDSNPDLNYLLGKRNLFDIPSIPKVTGPKQALHQLIYYKSEYPNQYPLELVQHLCPWLIWEQIPLNEQEGDVASISFVSTTPLVQLSNPNGEWFPLQPILVVEGYFQQDFIGLRDALKNVWQRSRPASLHQIKDPHIIFYLRINRRFLGLANHKGDLELTLGNDVAKNLRDLITSTIYRHLKSSIPKPSSWVEGVASMRNIDQGKLNEYKVQNDEYILNPSSPVAVPSSRRSGIHSSQPSMSEVETRLAEARIRHDVAAQDAARALQQYSHTPTPSQGRVQQSGSHYPTSILRNPTGASSSAHRPGLSRQLSQRSSQRSSQLSFQQQRQQQPLGTPTFATPSTQIPSSSQPLPNQVWMQNPANQYLGSQSPEDFVNEFGASPLGSSPIAPTSAAAPHGRIGRGALRSTASSPHLGRGSSVPAPTNRRPASPASRASLSSSVRRRGNVGPILGRGGIGQGPSSSPSAIGPAQQVNPQRPQQQQQQLLQQQPPQQFVQQVPPSSPDAFDPPQHPIRQRPQQVVQQQQQQPIVISSSDDYGNIDPDPQNWPQNF